MPDRRQKDRRESNLGNKKVVIPFTTFVFSIIMVLVLCLSILMAVVCQKSGYKKGYSQGYTDGYADGIYYRDEYNVD